MFDPTREQVRDLFFEAWRRYRAGEVVAGIETLALDVILAHPEYHAMLSEPQRYRERHYSDEANPFLHMSECLAETDVALAARRLAARCRRLPRLPRETSAAVTGSSARRSD